MSEILETYLQLTSSYNMFNITQNWLHLFFNFLSFILVKEEQKIMHPEYNTKHFPTLMEYY